MHLRRGSGSLIFAASSLLFAAMGNSNSLQGYAQASCCGIASNGAAGRSRKSAKYEVSEKLIFKLSRPSDTRVVSEFFGGHELLKQISNNFCFVFLVHPEDHRSKIRIVY